MKNKTYTKVASTIKELENKKNQEVSECMKLIADNEAVITNANHSINAKTNVTDFLTASDDKDKAERIVEVCKKKLEMIESEGVIDSDDYNKNKDAIRSEQKTISEEAYSKTISLLIELFKVHDNMLEQIGAFDKQIKDLSGLANEDIRTSRITTYHDENYALMNGTIGVLKQRMFTNNLTTKYFKDLASYRDFMAIHNSWQNK